MTQTPTPALSGQLSREWLPTASHSRDNKPLSENCGSTTYDLTKATAS
jgi:hypothetical protein